jgi:hypothetical protein
VISLEDKAQHKASAMRFIWQFRPTWYHFAFRLEAPWLGLSNRTVIHQVEQNILKERGQEYRALTSNHSMPL